MSPVGFGAWAIGGFWGPVDDDESMRALHAAIDAGVNFIDTADVYGDGRSERLVAPPAARAPAASAIYVATKAGRKLPVQTPDGYSRAQSRGLDRREPAQPGRWTRSTCCSSTVRIRPCTIGPRCSAYFDELAAAGKIRHYGVSVETIDEARKALRYPERAVDPDHLQSVPDEAGRDILCRGREGARRRSSRACRSRADCSPASSSAASQFDADDHRQFNRHGELFDQGETFSGVPFDVGLAAVEELRPLVPAGATMAQFALRWILMTSAVTCVIPGARDTGRRRATTRRSAGPARHSTRRRWRPPATSTIAASARSCTSGGEGTVGEACVQGRSPVH